MLREVVNSETWQKYETWQWELAFAVAWLVLVQCVSSLWLDMSYAQTWGNLIGLVAVVYTFKHLQVSSRLEEAQRQRSIELGPMAVEVECYGKLSKYLVRKEVLWVVSFALLGAWTALAGVPLFLGYPGVPHCEGGREARGGVRLSQEAHIAGVVICTD